MPYSTAAIKDRIDKHASTVLVYVGNQFQVRRCGLPTTTEILKLTGPASIVGYYKPGIPEHYLAEDIEDFLQVRLTDQPVSTNL